MPLRCTHNTEINPVTAVDVVGCSEQVCPSVRPGTINDTVSGLANAYCCSGEPIVDKPRRGRDRRLQKVATTSLLLDRNARIELSRVRKDIQRTTD